MKMNLPKFSIFLLLLFLFPRMAQSQCTLGFTSTQSAFGTNCTGLETDTDLAGTPIKQYFWDFGDGYFGAGVTNQIVHQYALPGSYEVIIKVIDVTENMCIDTVNLIVPDLGSCEAGYTAYANPYYWNQFEMRGLMTENTGPFSFSWDTGDMIQTFIHTLQGNTEDICVTIDNSGSCADGYCDSVQLNVLNYMVEEFYQITPSSGCNGVLAVSDSLFTDACSGVLVADPIGSIDFASAWIDGDTLFFNTCNNVNAVGIVNPSDCHGQYLCSSTSNAVLGDEEFHANSDIKVYPNPTVDEIQIKGFLKSSQSEVVVTVHNSLGELLEEYKFNDNIDVRVPILGPPGVFFVKISSEHIQEIVQIVKL